MSLVRSVGRAFLRSILALALAMPAHALAQATLLTGLGGPLDYGVDALPRADQAATPAPIDLTPTFPSGLEFFGTRYTSVYVNVDGNVSFGSPSTFDGEHFPRTHGAPMIAAWWANVDTRIAPGDPNANQVYYALTPEHFVVTWIDVGYFDLHTDLANAFQLVIAPRPGGSAGAFDVELRFHRCEWIQADDFLLAQIGLDAADGVHFVELPGSGTSDVLALCTSGGGSGGGTGGGPGLWSLDPAAMPRCGDGLRETGELCDDGNTEPHDFCDATCFPTDPCFTTLADGAVFVPLDAMSDDTGIPECPHDAGPPDTGLVDAGMDAGLDDAAAENDAGQDGGRRPDGGTRFDAGAAPDAHVGRDAGHANELDVGGGGCGCRAGARRSGMLVPALGMTLAVVLRRRRLRRAGARAASRARRS